MPPTVAFISAPTLPLRTSPISHLTHPHNRPPRPKISCVVTNPHTAAPNNKDSYHILCIGDCHDQFSAKDHVALEALDPAVVLFVGDFGDENLSVVETVANTPLPRIATAFGNHDAWYAFAPRRRARHAAKQAQTRLTRQQVKAQGPGGQTLQEMEANGRPPAEQLAQPSVDPIVEQLRLLQSFDVGYSLRRFDDIALSVAGGKPFSVGGPIWRNQEFYRKYYHTHSIAHSTERIINAIYPPEHVEAAPSSYIAERPVGLDGRASLGPGPGHDVIFLSHVGPVGLGEAPEAPCGRDWGPRPGGDYGDICLRGALDHVRTRGTEVPLVVFGHMHKQLITGAGQLRQMVVVETQEGLMPLNPGAPVTVAGGLVRDGKVLPHTVMVNTAVVPRVLRRLQNRRLMVMRHFVDIEFVQGTGVRKIDELWVDNSGVVLERIPMYSNDGAF